MQTQDGESVWVAMVMRLVCDCRISVTYAHIPPDAPVWARPLTPCLTPTEPHMTRPGSLCMRTFHLHSTAVAAARSGEAGVRGHTRTIDMLMPGYGHVTAAPQLDGVSAPGSHTPPAFHDNVPAVGSKAAHGTQKRSGRDMWPCVRMRNDAWEHATMRENIQQHMRTRDDVWEPHMFIWERATTYENAQRCVRTC